MKKLLLIQLTIGILNTTYAILPTNKGSIIGGMSSSISLSGENKNFFSLGYTKQKNEYRNTIIDSYTTGVKTIYLNLSPKIGYFFVNNLAIGLDINTGFTHSKTDLSKTTNTFLATGPFLRYYIPNKKIQPFAEIASSFGFMNTETEWNLFGISNDQKWKYNTTYLFGGVGINLAISGRVGFDILAGYNNFTNKTEMGKINTQTYGIRVGMIFLLNKKQSNDPS